MFLSLAITLLVTLAAPPEGPPEELALKEALAKIRPSVVVLREVAEPEPQEGKDSPKYGIGVVIDEKGLVIAPTIEFPAEAKLEAILRDKSKVAARRVLSDAKLGVDIFQLSADKLPPACSFLESDQLEVGETAILFGSGFGSEMSVLAGIVSAKNRDTPNAKGMLQFDCAIGPGTSPGVVLDRSGHVTSLIAPQFIWHGLGFGHPAEKLKEVVKTARSKITTP